MVLFSEEEKGLVDSLLICVQVQCWTGSTRPDACYLWTTPSVGEPDSYVSTVTVLVDVPLTWPVLAGCRWAPLHPHCLCGGVRTRGEGVGVNIGRRLVFYNRNFDPQMKNFHLRDEDRVDEIVGSQIRGAGLPAPERRVEVPAVEDGLRWRLHVSPEVKRRLSCSFILSYEKSRSRLVQSSIY